MRKEARHRPSTFTRAPERITGAGFFRIGVVAAALHGAFDAVTYAVPAMVPPYLRLWDAPEVFQTLSPIGISVAVSCVSGVIAVISTAAVEPRHRRAATLAMMITGFWLFSAILLRAVWLSTPWGTIALSLVMGVPRGAAVGWAAARLGTSRLTAPTDEAA